MFFENEIHESINYDSSSNTSIMEFFSMLGSYEEVFNEAANEKLTSNDLSKHGAYLNSFWERHIEELIAKNKIKKVSNYLYGMYFAIVGNCFGNEVPRIKKGEIITYKAKYHALWRLCKQPGYLNDKHKAKILQDAKGSIDACNQVIEKLDPKKDAVLIKYYQDYAKDLLRIK